MPSLNNLDLLSFISVHPIDKIVQEGEVTIVNSGAISFSKQAKIVTSTEINSYGRASLARARWSIDSGVSWQALESTLLYTFTDHYSGMFGTIDSLLSGLKAAISIGCDGSIIYFRTANGFHGDTTSDDSTTTYTPTSLTFLIQYKLYERE